MRICKKRELATQICFSVSHIVPRGLGVEWVFRGEHRGGDHDAEQDDVAKVGVVAQPVALLPQEVGGGEDEEAVLGRHRLGLVCRRGRLPLVGELLLLVVLLLTWHLSANNIKGNQV